MVLLVSPPPTSAGWPSSGFEPLNFPHVGQRHTRAEACRRARHRLAAFTPGLQGGADRQCWRDAARVAEMNDAELHVYRDEHLSDEALTTAMAPISSLHDSQQIPDWEVISQQVNGFLGPNWPAPPWSPGQVNTLAMDLALNGDKS
jgi:hypothetical protein